MAWKADACRVADLRVAGDVIRLFRTHARLPRTKRLECIRLSSVNDQSTQHDAYGSIVINMAST